MATRKPRPGHLRAVPDTGFPDSGRDPGNVPGERGAVSGRRGPGRGEETPILFPVADLVDLEVDLHEEPDRHRNDRQLDELDHLPIDELLGQLAELGLPPEMVEQSRALGDDHRAELADLLRAATAMLSGDPVDGMLSVWEPLLEQRLTVFEAELAAAEIVSTLDEAAGDDLVDGLTRLVAEAEHTGRPEALVMCRMLNHLGPEAIRGPATRAANTLAAGGIKDRPWVSSLGTVRFHAAYGFTVGPDRVLAVEFAYRRRSHAFILVVEGEPDALTGLYVADDVDELRQQVRRDAIAHSRPLDEIEAADAAALVRAALALPLRPDDEADEDEMECLFPVIRERLRHLP